MNDFTTIVEGSEPCVATECIVVMHDDDGRSPILEPLHTTPQPIGRRVLKGQRHWINELLLPTKRLTNSMLGISICSVEQEEYSTNFVRPTIEPARHKLFVVRTHFQNRVKSTNCHKDGLQRAA